MQFASEDPQVGETVITAEQIQTRVAELGAEITSAYQGCKPLLVGVLKGAHVFLSDIIRKVELPIDIDFVWVSSYGSATRTSGVVRILKDIETDISGRDVLLIEDIVDSGITLRYLRRSLKAQRPASVEVCSLIARESADVDNLDVKFVGFRVPDDEYLVGYGLDFDQKFRNLPYLATFDNECRDGDRDR